MLNSRGAVWAVRGNIGAETIKLAILQFLWGLLITIALFVCNISQNPILTIKAPIVGFRGVGL